MVVCTLPQRVKDSRVDDSTAAAARRLAAGLQASAEFQAYVKAARAVQEDSQVERLVQAIRACRALFGCQEKGALQSELESLDVMVDYERASQALRALVVDVDQAVSAAAGLDFIGNVRPDRHG
jgi:cell fate (sporulation/competence/biofilm development) regulator YlbF (YheA/YmcA/DUF963 family)